jgi:hypothetical protein
MRRRLMKAGLASLSLALPLQARARDLPKVDGLVWQLHGNAPDAKGSWHRLGAHELIVQWMAVDGVAFIPGTGMKMAPRLPDWERIAREPWARQVVVGLSGRFDEQRTRRSLDAMLTESLAITRLKFPFRVSGWYFPAEVDPHWTNAAEVLPPILAKLPRPLWISVYDGEGIGAVQFADWIASFIPRDVGIIFQDGVGAHGRSSREAREYADALVKRLGKDRVRLMVEAFRVQGRRFRPTTADELKEQLAAYEGQYLTYLFDGPHYVPERVIDGMTGR